MKSDEELHQACEESGMDYNRLKPRDKQALSDYLLSVEETVTDPERIRLYREKSYLAVLQDRLRRVDESKSKQRSFNNN